jgi:hypothetical protein
MIRELYETCKEGFFISNVNDLIIKSIVIQTTYFPMHNKHNTKFTLHAHHANTQLKVNFRYLMSQRRD